MAIRSRLVKDESTPKDGSRRARRAQEQETWEEQSWDEQPVATDTDGETGMFDDSLFDLEPESQPVALEDVGSSMLREIPIDDIEPNKDQPRSAIKEDDLTGLAQSISTYGIIHPIVVRPHGDRYQIIAGERRWRASKLAGLTVMPVRVMPKSDYETLEIALVENLQRSNLNPIEEAYGYVRLTSSYELTPGDLAARLGKSRSTLVNMMRLTELAEDIQLLVFQEKIKTGHARALLGLPEKFRTELAEFAVKEDLSVREVERIVRDFDGKKLDLTVKTFLPGLEQPETETDANAAVDGATAEDGVQTADTETSIDASSDDIDENAQTDDAATASSGPAAFDPELGVMSSADVLAAASAAVAQSARVSPRIPRRKKTQAEAAMVKRLGTNVQIKRSSRQNRLVIDFDDADDLARIVQLVCQTD